MKYNAFIRTILAVALVTLFLLPVAFSQDARIPGGDYADSVKAAVRNGKLVFSSDDGNFRWWLDSRIQYDAAKYFENKNELSDGTVLRRLTFAVKAMLWKDWEAELDVDFAEQVDTKSQVELRDMFVKWAPQGSTFSLQAGHFKEPFGMERLNSSRLLPFMERSSASNAFPMGRRVGFMARYWWDNLAQITAAVMGHEAGTRIDKGQRDEGYSTNLRGSVAPINTHGHNLHVGLAGSYKIPDAVSELPENTIEISARPETYVSNPKFLHTNNIEDVNYYLRYAGELMYINGPFYAQSEVMGTSIKRWYDKPTAHLQGGYVLAMFMLTGESRYYFSDEGEVGPIEQPKNPWGALEVGARFTITDLNDFGAGIKGGQANQLMTGVNYYPNSSIKIQFNYSFVWMDINATRKGNLYGDDDHSFIQMRFQASL